MEPGESEHVPCGAASAIHSGDAGGASGGRGVASGRTPARLLQAMYPTASASPQASSALTRVEAKPFLPRAELCRVLARTTAQQSPACPASLQQRQWVWSGIEGPRIAPNRALQVWKRGNSTPHDDQSNIKLLGPRPLPSARSPAGFGNSCDHERSGKQAVGSAGPAAGPGGRGAPCLPSPHTVGEQQCQAICRNNRGGTLNGWRCAAVPWRGSAPRGVLSSWMLTSQDTGGAAANPPGHWERGVWLQLAAENEHREEGTVGK